jgi:hypothetical protein
MAHEVERSAKGVTIEGTHAQIEVLRRDAAFYCDTDGPDQCPAGLKLSARATLRAIKKAA